MGNAHWASSFRMVTGLSFQPLDFHTGFHYRTTLNFTPFEGINPPQILFAFCSIHSRLTHRIIQRVIFQTETGVCSFCQFDTSLPPTDVFSFLP